MAKVVARQMNIFTKDKAHEFFPELHIVYRSDDDCAITMRSATGDVYKLTMLSGKPGLDPFLEGFSGLVVWYYSSIEEMSKRLEIGIV